MNITINNYIRINETKTVSELIQIWENTNNIDLLQRRDGFWNDENYTGMLEFLEETVKKKMLPLEYAMLMGYMGSVKAVMNLNQQQSTM